MQPFARLARRVGAVPPTASLSNVQRTFRSLAPLSANVAPAVGSSGPPPPPPAGESDGYDMARRRKRLRQMEMLRQLKNIKENGRGAKMRFWDDVSVREVDDHLQVFLDDRPLRHPSTKQIVRIPASKPHLATALALEWDVLTATQDATKNHLIPLTSLVCRALDIEAEGPAGPIRQSVTQSLMPYLDTDSLLCWAPEGDERTETLRELQRATADDVIGFLVGRVWPGSTIVPVLDGASIFPRSQEPGTRDVVQGWVSGLSSWELAGLERAVLAGKSVLLAARLVAEWSEGPAGVARSEGGERFGVELAARAASLEVAFQTGNWGEVEDTHDVEKEDVRRQLGSTVLLIAGEGR
ncbi:related to F1F0-ATPase complex assembly protein (ATP12 protein) [Cephalotrichum gorgonifer]|uniref:Related to F1F0-ATPase complex assembly protein (ATP12 protein) n=1 Tax=Cephalotrichum gorgonifer TaxID=2041049 RepID=A0AAE8MU13_9PEZI|nr:related to F1F0-ATPase complex assembly protein (ATP12 protein) [Cephalotrichum gorgonifer]